jgi:hypothetical protein
MSHVDPSVRGSADASRSSSPLTTAGSLVAGLLAAVVAFLVVRSLMAPDDPGHPPSDPPFQNLEQPPPSAASTDQADDVDDTEPPNGETTSTAQVEEQPVEPVASMEENAVASSPDDAAEAGDASRRQADTGREPLDESGPSAEVEKSVASADQSPAEQPSSDAVRSLSPKPELPERFGSMRVGEKIDLLARLDLERDAAGDWRFEEGELVSSTGRERIKIPVEVPPRYVLTAVVRRERGNDTLGLGLVVGPAQTAVVLNGWGGTTSGLHHLDGREANDNETTAPGKGRLRDDRFQTIVCVVRPDGVYVSHDGRTVIDWTGNPKRLSVQWGGIPRNRQLAVVTHDTSYRFREISLAPLETLKQPVPALAARQAAEQQLRDLFRTELARATRPADKLELARTLLQQAAESLLRRARR